MLTSYWRTGAHLVPRFVCKSDGGGHGAGCRHGGTKMWMRSSRASAAAVIARAEVEGSRVGSWTLAGPQIREVTFIHRFCPRHQPVRITSLSTSVHITSLAG